MMGSTAARAAAAWASGSAWLAHELCGLPGAASRHTRGEAVADGRVLVPEVLPLLLPISFWIRLTSYSTN